MRKLGTIVVAPLTLVLALSAPSFAQQRHAVPPSQLSQAVAERVANQDTQRAAIRTALAQPEVARVAASAGIDLAKVASAADTLGPEALTRAAAAANDVNQSLVGGASTVTISTTAIIIILLIVILIVVAD